MNTKRPRETKRNQAAKRGFEEFEDADCASCHIPRLDTESRMLPVSFPEIPTDPFANVFLEVDLTNASRFKPAGGGVRVPLYSDLKRHDMAPELADAAGADFITPRLWGIADTAPYMHDGAALSLREAIERHGGEGQAAADNFVALTAGQQSDMLAFLETLRAPKSPHADIDDSANQGLVADDGGERDIEN